MYNLNLSGNQLRVPSTGDCYVRLPGASVPTVYVQLDSPPSTDLLRRLIVVESYTEGVTLLWPSNVIQSGSLSDVLAQGTTFFDLISINGVTTVIRLANAPVTQQDAAETLTTFTSRHVDLGRVSGTVELDMSVSRSFSCVLTDDVSFLFTNWPTSGIHACMLQTENVSGAAASWPEELIWVTGAEPTLSGAHRLDRFTFVNSNVPYSGVQGFAVLDIAKQPNVFKITVNIASDNEYIGLPFDSFSSYDCVVDWGDASSDSFVGVGESDWPSATHQYDTSGMYQITITGTIPVFSMDNGTWGHGGEGDPGFATQLLSVDAWGYRQFDTFDLVACTALTTVAPIPAGVLPAACPLLFSECSALQLNLAEHDWSGVTSLQSAFSEMSFDVIPTDFSVPDLVNGTYMFLGCHIGTLHGDCQLGSPATQPYVDLSSAFESAVVQKILDLNFTYHKTANLFIGATGIEEMTVVALDNAGTGNLELGSGPVGTLAVNEILRHLVDREGDFANVNMSFDGVNGADLSIATARSWYVND